MGTTQEAGSDVVEAGMDATPDITEAGSDVPGDTPVDVPVDAPDASLPMVTSVFVSRVGDGTAALSAASTAVFVEEYAFTGGAARRTIPMPVAAMGANQPLTLGGSNGPEGQLSRSLDGRYVVLAGYGTAPGMASVAVSMSSAVNRVVARINAAGTVDTSSRLVGLGGAQVRSVASVDGSAFWLAGGIPGGAAMAGVWHLPFGMMGGTQVTDGAVGIRRVGVIGSQLHAVGGAPGFFLLHTVGTGLPTAPPAPLTPLMGMTDQSPYDFLAVRRTAPTGVDTIYFADDRATAMGGGIQRWTFDGTRWSLDATFNMGLTAGVRGLAGFVTPAGVTLFVVTAETPSRVLSYIDTGAMTTAPPTVIATAGANTAFRGVALAPIP